MTENKRFHYKIDEVGVYYYICDGGETEDKIFAEVMGDVEEVTDKLNELHEENQYLKEYNNKLMKQPLLFDVKTIPKTMEIMEANTKLGEENEKLKQELNKLKKFEYGGEHIRLSINIETGELQRHIYATGQWFGDFDRVLVDNWLSKEDYQRFINRVIEVYNTEFKKGLEE